jgi:hypothetical protein
MRVGASMTRRLAGTLAGPPAPTVAEGDATMLIS